MATNIKGRGPVGNSAEIRQREWRNSRESDQEEEQTDNDIAKTGVLKPSKPSTSHSNTKKNPPKPEASKFAPIYPNLKELKEKNLEENSSLTSKIICALVITVGTIIAYNIYANPGEEVELRNPEEIFHKLFPKLRDEFKEEPEYTFRNLNFTITQTLFNENPPSPGVILLLGTKGRDQPLGKLQERLTDLIKKVYNYVKSTTINCKDLPDDVSKAKLTLTNRIDESIMEKNLISIENVDHLVSECIAALHPYFDHESAPHKNVIYLLTALTDRSLAQGTIRPKSLRELAMAHFNEMWRDYPQDHREAMYSRMFTSMAILVSPID